MNVNSSFHRIWSKYTPLITLKIKQAIVKNELQEFAIDRFDFANTSSNKNAAFSFSLEFKNGVTMNSMKLTAVAREFAAAINENPTAKEMIKSGHFTFKMGSKFIMTIEKVNPPQEV
jgi:hypothetical protein